MKELLMLRLCNIRLIQSKYNFTKCKQNTVFLVIYPFLTYKFKHISIFKVLKEVDFVLCLVWEQPEKEDWRLTRTTFPFTTSLEFETTIKLAKQKLLLTLFRGGGKNAFGHLLRLILTRIIIVWGCK